MVIVRVEGKGPYVVTGAGATGAADAGKPALPPNIGVFEALDDAIALLLPLTAAASCAVAAVGSVL